MVFIEINKGLRVDASKIIAIEEAAEGTFVYTDAGKFSSNLPSESLMHIMATVQGKEEDSTDRIASALDTLKKNSQIFGG